MKFFAIFLIFIILNFAIKTPAKEYPISSGRSIELRADSLFEMVSKQVSLNSRKQEKFKAIRLTTDQLQQLLNGEETTDQQTAYIKEYISALSSLPTLKEFKTSECEDYGVDDKAQSLLQSLCGRAVKSSTL